MAVEAGTKLGRYEIRSKIGEGGMGEVYLARDTQLDRLVAIKLLPAEIARDQQRLHRFLQEARAAAALSHANIAHIYEIGEAEGAYFIAMEYVEGIPLDHKIGARSLPIGEALDVAIQITDALDEAHGKGITHRDIKSPNIMITPRGRVKVLDFGLAKITQSASTPEQISDSQLATRVKTSPGVIMGTVNYMSPEQASGKEVDARTDIWSVGVVLYEMVTGRVPFEGMTPSHIIVAILEKEPLPLATYLPNVPEALDWIVTETLTKDATERTQTARELMKRLQRLKQRVDAEAEVERSVSPERLSVRSDPGTQSGTKALSSSAATPASTGFQTAGPRTSEVAAIPTNLSSAEYVVTQIKGHKKVFVLVAALALLIASGIGLALYKFINARRTSIISLEAAKFTRLTTTGNATAAAISPDGKWLVHVQDDGEQKSLWLRQVVVANSNTQIVPPANVRFYGLAFSPDGNYVYYVVGTSSEATGTLYQVPVLGGTPRKLFTGIKTSLSFSPDGKQIAYFDFYEDDDRLMIANADGSGQRLLAKRGGDEYFYQDDFANVSWSPDGKTLAAPIASARESYMSIATVSVASGELKSLTPQRWLEVRQVFWLDPHTVLATIQERNGEAFSIWQITFPAGVATKLTNDLNSYPTISLTADAGSIAAVKRDVENNIWLMPAFDVSRATQITQGRNLVGRPAFTPDGKLVCPIKEPVGGNLYLIDPATGNRKQLTADARDNVSPSVSSDGRYIVFISDRTGSPHVWRIDIDGSNPKQLTQTAEDLDANISPDGRWVTYTSCLNKCTVWKVGIDGGQPVQLTDRFSQASVFSPDGKQIACRYLDQPNGQYQLAILPSEGGAPIKTFPLANGVSNRRWSIDGRALIYGITQKDVTNLWAQPIDGSPPKQLTNFASEIIFGFDLSRDGKQVALQRGTASSDVVLISNFKQ
jgi:serine/threonine protein kinase/Tol biopolymer transport system component